MFRGLLLFKSEPLIGYIPLCSSVTDISINVKRQTGIFQVAEWL